MARDADKPDFNEEELKLFGYHERKVIDDMKALKVYGLNGKISVTIHGDFHKNLKCLNRQLTLLLAPC